MAVDAAGNWVVTWIHSGDSFGGSLGQDLDALIARSVDGGVTWGPSAAMSTSAAGDGSGDDIGPILVHDGVDRWVAVWSSDANLEQGLGDDTDILVVTATDACAAAPGLTCKLPTQPGKSRVKIKNKLGGRDKMTWKWGSGQETTLADLGDPLTTSDYAFCVYDQTGSVPTLVMEKAALAAGQCKNKPCWKASSGGYRYGDGRRDHGAIRGVKIRADEEGRARIKLKAVGPTLGPPVMPLSQDTAVEVQLHNVETGVCWSATYSTADDNSSLSFRARSD